MKMVVVEKGGNDLEEPQKMKVLGFSVVGLDKQFHKGLVWSSYFGTRIVPEGPGILGNLVQNHHDP